MGLQSASGGLTKSRLELATAVPGDVVAGKTFYAGDKYLKTGAVVNKSENPDCRYETGNNTPVILGDDAFKNTNTDDVERALIRYNGNPIFITGNTLFGIPKNNMIQLFNHVYRSHSKYGSNNASAGYSFSVGGTAIKNGLLFLAMARVNNVTQISDISISSGSCTFIDSHQSTQVGGAAGTVYSWGYVYALKDVAANAIISLTGNGVAINTVAIIVDLS